MRREIQVLLLTIIISLNYYVINGIPLKGTNKVVSTEAMSYLKKYGYMSSDQSEENMVEAVRKMQAFSGLKVTGELDSETIEKMEQKRCGVPDMEGTGRLIRNRRYSLFGTKWSSNDLTYGFTSFPGGNELTEAETRSAVEAAFKLWTDVTPLTFAEETDGTPVIDIQFVSGDHGDGDAFDGVGGVLAHAYFPDSAAIGGDVHFDDDEIWVSALEIDEITTDDDIDLYQVAGHEFGHSLGLDHSDDNDALMAPFYRGFVKDFQLGQDDILGIQALYGVAPTTLTPELVTTASCYSAANYNAASIIAGEIYIFEVDLFWRLVVAGQVDTGLYPANTSQYFSELPSGEINAVFERISDKLTVFIQGYEYWLYNGTSKVDGYPRPLTDFGFTNNLTIDAAFSWTTNGKTYFFSGDQYWRYNETGGQMDFDYPKNISDDWIGVPNDLDAVFEYQNFGDIYFIKDEEVFVFNVTTMEVVVGFPKPAAAELFGCTEDEDPPTTRPTTRDSTTSHASVITIEITSGANYMYPNSQLYLNIIFLLSLLFL